MRCRCVLDWRNRIASQQFAPHGVGELDIANDILGCLGAPEDVAGKQNRDLIGAGVNPVFVDESDTVAIAVPGSSPSPWRRVVPDMPVHGPESGETGCARANQATG